MLWVDHRRRENNSQGIAFLNDVLDGHGCLGKVSTAAEALAQLDPIEPDLILTHWGVGAATVPEYGSAAEQVLAGLRARPRRAPVIVFTWNSPDDAPPELPRPPR